MSHKQTKHGKLINIIKSVCLIGSVTFLPTTFAKSTYIPAGYSIETIGIPNDVRFHITGLDTDKHGDVYVATRFGDVWRYSEGKWNQFARSLHEPTGLMCDDDGSIVVTQKPELTRLVDINKDGVADDYIHLASHWTFHDNYHEFNFGPVKDKEGNYYGTLNLSNGNPDAFKLGAMGSAGGYRGWAYKVTPSGEFIPYASGLRSPAGLGMSPKQEIFFTDNQGDWVETSKLHLLEQGKFYGHPISLVDSPDFTPELINQKKYDYAYWDKMREQPVVWIPHQEVANSPGNPEWDISEGKFGPFTGQMFIGDHTQSNVFRVLLDKVKGRYQGAVINFIDGFQSGNIRLKFDNQGHLWVGQTARGWGAKGKKPFGLQKVKWDGTTPFELLNMQLTKTGFKLSFTKPLEQGSVIADSFMATQWNYKYTGAYGSPKKNVKKLRIESVILSDDKKSVEVNIPLTAGKVVMLEFNGVKSKDADSVSVSKVYYTLNQTY